MNERNYVDADLSGIFLGDMANRQLFCYAQDVHYEIVKCSLKSESNEKYLDRI